MQVAEPNLALYQIEQRLSELLEMRNTAVEEGAAPAELEAIDKLFEEYFLREVKKVDGICHALHAFEEAASVAYAESERLKRRSQDLELQYNRIKSATLKAMQDHGVRVLETPTNKLRVQANGGLEPLEVDDPRLLPSEFQMQTVKLTMKQWEQIGRWLGRTNGGLELWHKIDDKLNWNGVEADNQNIRSALKRGEEVPGAKLLPRGFHLRIE